MLINQGTVMNSGSPWLVPYLDPLDHHKEHVLSFFPTKHSWATNLLCWTPKAGRTLRLTSSLHFCAKILSLCLLRLGNFQSESQERHGVGWEWTECWGEPSGQVPCLISLVPRTGVSAHSRWPAQGLQGRCIQRMDPA